MRIECDVIAGVVQTRKGDGVVVVVDSVDSKVSAAAISLACLPHPNPCPALFTIAPS
jgi:hypothetical protein